MGAFLTLLIKNPMVQSWVFNLAVDVVKDVAAKTDNKIDDKVPEAMVLIKNVYNAK